MINCCRMTILLCKASISDYLSPLHHLFLTSFSPRPILHILLFVLITKSTFPFVTSSTSRHFLITTSQTSEHSMLSAFKNSLLPIENWVAGGERMLSSMTVVHPVRFKAVPWMLIVMACRSKLFLLKNSFHYTESCCRFAISTTRKVCLFVLAN